MFVMKRNITMKNVEPGDRLILLIASNAHVYEPYEFSFETEQDTEGLYKFRCPTSSGAQLTLALREHEFELLEPSDSIPRKGDKIIVTDDQYSDLYNGVFAVNGLSCKSDNSPDGGVWISANGSYSTVIATRIASGDYEILKRPKLEPLVSCKDCGGIGKIMLFTSTTTCLRCDGKGQSCEKN